MAPFIPFDRSPSSAGSELPRSRSTPPPRRALLQVGQAQSIAPARASKVGPEGPGTTVTLGSQKSRDVAGAGVGSVCLGLGPRDHRSAFPELDPGTVREPAQSSKLRANELSWLRTCSAVNAAERLRVGVTFWALRRPSDHGRPSHGPHHLPPGRRIRTHGLPPARRARRRDEDASEPEPVGHGAGAGAGAGRPGPSPVLSTSPRSSWKRRPMRVSIEPGSGTRRFHGDEVDIRRTIQVPVGHGHGEGTQLQRAPRR